MRKLRPHSKSFLKACKKRKIEVSIEVMSDDTVITSVYDNDVPHHYHNEDHECVYHIICKKILSEILHTYFSDINETEIRKYLLSRDWFDGMEIIYKKILTLKESEFKEWHCKQTKNLADIRALHIQ